MLFLNLWTCFEITFSGSQSMSVTHGFIWKKNNKNLFSMKQMLKAEASKTFSSILSLCPASSVFCLPGLGRGRTAGLYSNPCLPFISLTFHRPSLWIRDKGTAQTAELLFCLLLFILSALHGTSWMNDSPSTGPLDCDPMVTSLFGLVLTGSSLKSLTQTVGHSSHLWSSLHLWNCWGHLFLGSGWKVAKKAANLSYHGNLPFWVRAYIVAGSSSASRPHLLSSQGSFFLAPTSPRAFQPTKYGEQWYPELY